MKYVRLVGQMKRSKRPSVKLPGVIANLRSEADEGGSDWMRIGGNMRLARNPATRKIASTAEPTR